MTEALTCLCDAPPPTGEVANEVTSQVFAGRMLSQAMAKTKRFPAYAVGIIQVVEKTGGLAKALDHLADAVERLDSVNTRLRSALTYPCFLLVASAVLIATMMFWVLPVIQPIFETTSIELPFLTRLILWPHKVLTDPLGQLVGGLVLANLLYLGYQLYRSLNEDSQAKVWVDRVVLRLPVLGRLLERLIAARFSFVMALALECGHPFHKALALGAQGSSNQDFQARAESAIRLLETGETLAEAMEQYTLLPGGMVKLVAVGETAGRLGRILRLVANSLESELELIIETLVSLVEPVILSVMGVFVGVVLIGTFQPLLTLISSLA